MKRDPVKCCIFSQCCLDFEVTLPIDTENSIITERTAGKTTLLLWVCNSLVPNTIYLTEIKNVVFDNAQFSAVELLPWQRTQMDITREFQGEYRACL